MTAFAEDHAADVALVQPKLPGCGTLRFVNHASLVAEDLSRHQSRIDESSRLRVFDVLGLCTPLKVLDSVIGLDAVDMIDLAETVGIRKVDFSDQAMNEVTGPDAVSVQNDCQIATAVQAGLQNPVRSTSFPRQALHLANLVNLIKPFVADYVFHYSLIRLARGRSKLMIRTTFIFIINFVLPFGCFNLQLENLMTTDFKIYSISELPILSSGLSLASPSRKGRLLEVFYWDFYDHRQTY